MASAIRESTSASYCISLVQTALIKAAQKTNHICSALIYMQLKFHVNQDKPDRRRAGEKHERGRRRERRGQKGSRAVGYKGDERRGEAKPTFGKRSDDTVHPSQWQVPAVAPF